MMDTSKYLAADAVDIAACHKLRLTTTTEIEQFEEGEEFFSSASTL